MGAIGVVYGDIGTSPLYAFKKCFSTAHILVSEANVLGVTSLIFWALCIVVSLKYVHFILRADNHGEGGILALTTLCANFKNKHTHKIILFLGVLGAALFYGDGVMTPAISVLSALEGLSLISSIFTPYISSLAIGLLLLFFLAQKKGTEKIGMFFSPVMVLWFGVIGALGLLQICQTPTILYALNPYYGLRFFATHGQAAVLTFGAVVLVLTGAEALYADMGHFSKKAIGISWFYLVFPALLLNYFGQGALLLKNPHGIENPFYLLMPSGGVSSLVVLSTVASIIASQSIVSGIFSISWQAIQLGYFPRMRVIHTSARNMGQVYVPLMNYGLLFLTVLAVLIFQSSESLASAYGITVTGIMLITTLLGMVLAFYGWKWRPLKIGLIFGPFLLMDFLFLGSSLVKFLEGGWFPLAITVAIYMVITTWQRGRAILSHEREHLKLSLRDFIGKATHETQMRIPGTGIFMCRAPGKVPSALIIHLHHNKFLFQKMVFLSLVTQNIPKVPPKDRIRVSRLQKDMYQVSVFYGFIEVPNIHHILERLKEFSINVDYHESTFLLSRGIPISSSSAALKGWREKLFIFLSHNAMNAIEFFKIPHHRVMELGVHFKA